MIGYIIFIFCVCMALLLFGKGNHSAGFLFLFVIPLACGFSMLYGYKTDDGLKYIVEEKRTPIYSCGMGSEIHGDISGIFLIISGEVNEEIYYYYYIDNGNGGKILRKTLAVNGYSVYEDENETPYLSEKYSVIVTKDGTKQRDFFNLSYPQYEFHVPYGSIMRNYNLSVAGV